MSSPSANATSISRTGWRAGQHSVLIGLLLLQIAIFSRIGYNFATVGNAFEILRLSVEVGLLAVALTPVIITVVMPSSWRTARCSPAHALITTTRMSGATWGWARSQRTTSGRSAASRRAYSRFGERTATATRAPNAPRRRRKSDDLGASRRLLLDPAHERAADLDLKVFR